MQYSHPKYGTYTVFGIYSPGSRKHRRCKVRFHRTNTVVDCMLTHAVSSGRVRDPSQVKCLTFIVDDGTPHELQERIRRLYRVIWNRVRVKDSVALSKDWSNYGAFYSSVKLLPGFDKWAQSSSAKYHIDKDTLVPGNRIYGPETCQFILAEENRKQGSDTLRASIRDTQTGEVYESQTEASEATGVSQQSISYSCRKAKNGRFRFHYKESVTGA